MTHRFSNLSHPKKNSLFLTFPSTYIWWCIFPWVRLEPPYLSICSCKMSGTLFKTSQHSLCSTSQEEFCKFYFISTSIILLQITTISHLNTASQLVCQKLSLFFIQKLFLKNIKFDHVNLLLKLSYYLPHNPLIWPLCFLLNLHIPLFPFLLWSILSGFLFVLCL